MAELLEGEKSWQKMLKPVRGQYTFSAIRNFLRDPPVWQMKSHCKALGIELTPFVRSELNVRKVYKAKYRFLTEDEARRIIERHRMLAGRKFERDL